MILGKLDIIKLISFVIFLIDGDIFVRIVVVFVINFVVFLGVKVIVKVIEFKINFITVIICFGLKIDFLWFKMKLIFVKSLVVIVILVLYFEKVFF